MSIKKLDFATVIQNKQPFTVFKNVICQNIDDPTAGMIWVFLSTLPPLWEVNRTHLMKKFKCGRDKLDKHLTYLKTVGLLEFEPIRNPGGAFVKWNIIVNADSPYFNQFIQSTENQYSGEKEPVDNSCTTILKTQGVVKPGSGKSDTYKRNTHSVKTKENKKTKAVSVFSCSKDVQNHLEDVLHTKNVALSQEQISQVLFYVGDSLERPIITKRINTALKLLREGKWNIPSGWKGITSKTIAAKEEAYMRQKEMQQIEDGKINRTINKTIGYLEAKKRDKEEMQRLGLSENEYYSRIFNQNKVSSYGGDRGMV